MEGVWESSDVLRQFIDLGSAVQGSLLNSVKKCKFCQEEESIADDLASLRLSLQDDVLMVKKPLLPPPPPPLKKSSQGVKQQLVRRLPPPPPPPLKRPASRPSARPPSYPQPDNRRNFVSTKNYDAQEQDLGRRRTSSDIGNNKAPASVPLKTIVEKKELKMGLQDVSANEGRTEMREPQIIPPPPVALQMQPEPPPEPERYSPPIQAPGTEVPAWMMEEADDDFTDEETAPTFSIPIPVIPISSAAVQESKVSKQAVQPANSTRTTNPITNAIPPPVPKGTVQTSKNDVPTWMMDGDDQSLADVTVINMWENGRVLAPSTTPSNEVPAWVIDD